MAVAKGGMSAATCGHWVKLLLNLDLLVRFLVGCGCGVIFLQSSAACNSEA